jgi:type II secretory pathway pseudopilin PulG
VQLAIRFFFRKRDAFHPKLSDACFIVFGCRLDFSLTAAIETLYFIKFRSLPLSFPMIDSKLILQPDQSMVSHPRICAFSMVEILAVVALIGILTALTVPALSMLNGRSVGIGATRFAETVQLARSEAITRRAPVRLRLAKNWAGQPDRNMRAFSLWTLPPNGDYGTAADWVQIGPWQDLPVGVAAVSDDTVNAGSLWGAMREEGILQSAGTDIEIVSLEFSPTGAIVPANGGGGLGSALQLRFSLGTYSETGDFIRSGPEEGWLDLEIESLTGFSRILHPSGS